ncbi:OpgC domain-containing protein [Paraburkholderia sp. LFS083]|uniref:OpgC domain-containing protein n=1 Tax=Paraburkholderia TaxID=1822464 RepID=UPI003A80B420
MAAVLPTYVLFAYGVTLSVPFAQRLRKLSFQTTSPFVHRFIAPWAGAKLPSATGEGWPFNPFAWQLMFTLEHCAASDQSVLDHVRR